MKRNRTEYSKEYYKQNKDKITLASKKHYHENKEYYAEAHKLWVNNNRESRLLSQAKSRAKCSGFIFNLTKSDIIIPENCPIFNIPLTYILGKGRQQYNPSIDRIDSSLGYTPDNIQIISDLANRMKQNATKDQLIAFAKGILKHYEEQ